MTSVDVCIVGGGISGLTSAYQLAKQGVRIRVVEAGERLGGRIYSPKYDSSHFDIGPSWFWPGQSHIEKLLLELKLSSEVFQQYSEGDALYESFDGKLHRGVAGISMQGSNRINGGLARVIDALSLKIKELCGVGAIHLNAPVTHIERSKNAITVRIAEESTLTAKYVIMALPPRVAISTIEFLPSLSEERLNELNNIATWMAGHAKATVIYETAFWRQLGLSGDVISQMGVLSEIHDASAFSETGVGQAALFGFFATEPAERETEKSKIDEIIIAQLVRIFGPNAGHPKAILYKNWANDSLVATNLDQRMPNHHPMNRLSTPLEPEWQSRLIWSGSETAKGNYNGYIEGALIASRVAVNLVLQ